MGFLVIAFIGSFSKGEMNKGLAHQLSWRKWNILKTLRHALEKSYIIVIVWKDVKKRILPCLKTGKANSVVILISLLTSKRILLSVFYNDRY